MNNPTPHKPIDTENLAQASKPVAQTVGNEAAACAVRAPRLHGVVTRRGKIARLPRALRDELNQRIEDGETGARIAEWLNRREDVQGVLKRDFGGRPINEQNISDWRAGGYADWQEQQATFDLANGMMDEAAERKDLVTDGRLADHVGDMAALMLAKMIRALRRMEDGPEQWEIALKVVREVVRLRKSDREFEEAQRRRETQERYAEIERFRAQVRAKSPSERLEEILAERRREVGGGMVGGETEDWSEDGEQRTEDGAGTEGWSEDGGQRTEDGEQRASVSVSTAAGETVSPPEVDKPVGGETVVSGPRGEGAVPPSEAAVTAVPQESSGFIKVNQGSRTEGWIGRVGSIH